MLGSVPLKIFSKREKLIQLMIGLMIESSLKVARQKNFPKNDIHVTLAEFYAVLIGHKFIYHL